MSSPRLRSIAVALLLATGLSSTAAVAQPGTQLADSAVSADIKTLFALAGQVYPAFASGSGYYSFSGYTYKFFAGAGVYAGIKDGQVYLMGGPYGSAPSAKGTVAALTTALQNAANAIAQSGGGSAGGNGAIADFGNITSVKTTYDLPRLFEELTMEWVSAGITSQLKMERQGVEAVGSVSTEKLKITLSATTLATPTIAEMWVDSTGTVRRYIANGFEYAPAQADLIGRGLVSSMLLALAAADATTIQVAIANELKNPALATKVSKKAIGGGSYDTLAVTIGTSASLNYQVELTDFGSFSMATRFQAKIGTLTSTSFQVLSMRLR